MGAFFDRIIAQYGIMLNWVLDRQRATLMVAAGTLVLTVLLYIWIPKGFFPHAGYRPDPGHHASAAIDFLFRHGRAAGKAGGADPQRSGGGKPVILYRR